MKVTVLVKIELKHPIANNELRMYVKDAVETWCGQYHPDDALRTGIQKVTTRILDKSW